MERLIIYQLFPRIFANRNANCVPNGTLSQNGSGKFNDFDMKTLYAIKDLGVNCVWMTGIIEHATKSDFSEFGIDSDNPNVVKGEAGSPYAIKDFYDVAPELSEYVPERMKEFEAMLERVHEAGLKFIMDFVPNHTARRYHSDMAPKGVEDLGSSDDVRMNFRKDNNYYYISNQKFHPDFPLDAEGSEPYIEFPAKATGNDCFNAFCSRNDWYETVKLNYGHDYNDGSDHFHPVPDTWLKMLNVLRYWASKGIDGFRCDMVFMVPLPFWHWAIPQVKEIKPDIIFIGEIYDVAQYRPFLDYGRFDYLYDKVNLYDTLVGIETKGVSAAALTGAWQTVDGIGDRMLNFLENHDEVRFASKSYAGDAMRVIPSLVVSSMISKGPFLIYYGQELGEPGRENEGFAGYNDRTTIFDYWSLSTVRRWINSGAFNEELMSAHEKWLRKLYKKVLTLCNSNAAIREGGFFDLMYHNLMKPGFDPHNIFTFLRYKNKEIVLIIANFARESKTVEIEIPELAYEMTGLQRKEIVTTDVLWEKNYRLDFKSGKPISVYLHAADALILPIGILTSASAYESGDSTGNKEVKGNKKIRNEVKTKK